MSILDRPLAWLGYERKANPVFMQFANYGELPQPRQMQANPKAFAKEGYRRNDTVHKCISYIARNAAEIRLALYTDSTKKREIENHSLLDKLAVPNKDQSGNDLIEAVCSCILMAGNSYIWALRVAKAGPPDELWSLRPDWVDIVPSKGGIIGYDYKSQQPPVRFDPALIGHTKFWSPDDDLYGLSPIEVAAIFVDMNLAYNKWNLALTQNYAQPPGAWTTPALLGKKERDVLEHKLHKDYQGYKNAGKAPVLDGGLKFDSMAVPPAQMAWLEGRQANAATIANIYSLAPQIIGDTSASTYNNMEEAKYASYTESIFPLMDKLMGTFNRWLVPMYGKNLYLSYDKQSVETIQKIMQAQESAKAERWTKIWLAGGCTLAKYQEELGMPSDPQGNVYRIKDLIIAADKLEEYAEQCLTAPAAPPMPQPEPLEQPPGGNNDTRTQPGQGSPPAKQPKDGAKKLNMPAPEQETARLAALVEAYEGQAKSLDRNGIYQPDDLDEQLAVLRMKGVSYVQWKTLTKGGGCDICVKNDGEIRKLGDPFPSGHILPVAHPNCECEVIPAEMETRKQAPIDLQQRRSRRDEYRAFTRRYVS